LATNIWESGDLNNDGIVDQLDLNAVTGKWQTAYAPSGIALAAAALRGPGTHDPRYRHGRVAPDDRPSSSLVTITDIHLP